MNNSRLIKINNILKNYILLLDLKFCKAFLLKTKAKTEVHLNNFIYTDRFVCSRLIISHLIEKHKLPWGASAKKGHSLYS